MDFPVLGLTSFDGRQREAGGGVTKQRYTRGKGGKVEGWRGHYTWSVGLVESWKIKSVQFPGDTLSDLATPVLSFLFRRYTRRRREKEEKISILESRDFEYLADKKRILTIE